MASKAATETRYSDRRDDVLVSSKGRRVLTTRPRDLASAVLT